MKNVVFVPLLKYNLVRYTCFFNIQLCICRHSQLPNKNRRHEKDMTVVSLTTKLTCPFYLTNGKHSDILAHNTSFFSLQINCICPNNDNPGSFREKMTVVKRWNEMTPEEREIAQENPRSRFFKCRDRNGRGRGIF